MSRPFSESRLLSLSDYGLINNQNNALYTPKGTSLTNSQKEVTIPKIIMQTWKNKRVPKRWQQSPESIKEHMPDWEYVLMTDDDNRKFVQKHFPRFLPYYDNFPYGIQRADAIRYMWLYVNGGIYMDLDFKVLKSFDQLFYNDNEVFFVLSGNVGSCITNSFMASKPGCKVWLDMLDWMMNDLPWWCVGKHMVVMNSTGPIGLNYVVKQTKIVYGSLPNKLIMPCSVCNIETCDTSNALLKPLPGSSWISYDTMFFNWWLCNWKLGATVIAVILFIIVFYLILWYKGYFKNEKDENNISIPIDPNVK